MTDDRITQWFRSLTRRRFDALAKCRRRGRVWHVSIRPDFDFAPERRLTIRARSRDAALATAWKHIQQQQETFPDAYF